MFFLFITEEESDELDGKTCVFYFLQIIYLCYINAHLAYINAFNLIDGETGALTGTTRNQGKILHFIK